MKKIKAASVQFNHRPGDKEANTAIVRSFVQQAAEQQVQLIAFPEMCITGYWHLRDFDREQLEPLVEAVPNGPTTQELLKLSAEHKMTIGAGTIERANDGQLFNTYIVAMPDGNYASYRKLHCFINANMSSGNDYVVFDDATLGCRIGILICYDNNIIENVRIYALRGAEIMLAPQQTGGCVTPSPHCMGGIDVRLWDNREADPAAIEAEFKGSKGRGWLLTWLPARAHDNGVFLLFSNGVGQDDNEVRTGNAMIIDPYGRILAETWQAKDEMVIAELDADLIKNSTGQRWINSRRPDLYTPLTEATGREKDIRKVRFEKAE